MDKFVLKKQILKISEGLLSSLTDLILLFFILGYESLLDPRLGRSLPYTLAKLDRRMRKINYLSIKRALRHISSKGWIKENLELTEEGQKRLKEFFLEYYLPSGWNGNWYLTNYDIPENLKGKRDILRENLERLGCAKLQNSVWISPYNFLGDIEKIVKELNLSSYVILAVSSKVGREESKTLVEKIWKIPQIQQEYQKFISEFREKENVSPLEVFFKYHSILRKDPRLPKDLLPEHWLGEEAYHLYCKLTKNFKKSILT